MPKKLRERTRKILIENFEYTVVVIVSNDIHQSAVNRHMDIQSNWYACHAGASNALVSYIFLPDKSTPDVVAHESFHCIWHMMKMIGAEPEEEVIAYNLSHLVRTICRLLASNAKARHKKVRIKAKVKAVSA